MTHDDEKRPADPTPDPEPTEARERLVIEVGVPGWEHVLEAQLCAGFKAELVRNGYYDLPDDDGGDLDDGSAAGP